MKKAKILSLGFTILLTLFISRTAFAVTPEEGEIPGLSEEKVAAINEIIRQKMTEGKIPGIYLVVNIGDKTVYSQGFGYADVKISKPITADTVFELGSNSKAFTGLAILKLEQEGLLNRNDPVDQYIPWLEMRYKGEKAAVTVEQVMGHTSGIPFQSIDRIPETDADTALEDTVRTLAGSELQSKPGETFSYATINYDILGYIIENLSGQSYEAYISENILTPIRLSNTYMFRKDVNDDMSKGYKPAFLQAVEYEAPIYEGHKPAGYILSNGNDIAKWMLTQLNFNEESTFDQKLIARSHEFNNTSGDTNISYNAGWYVNGITGEIYHGGSNPNFSSGIILDVENGIGVAVLANLNSIFTEEIANNIMDIIQGTALTVSEISDEYLELDKIATTVICIAVLVIFMVISMIIRFVYQVVKKQRDFVIPGLKGLVSICLSVVILGILGLLVYRLPGLFLGGITWRTAIVWAPQTLFIAVVIVAAAIGLIYMSLIADFLYKRKEGQPLFFTVFVSIMSGMGNALIVFTINEALRQENALQLNYLLYFSLGIVIYLGGSRIVRAKLIQITNRVVYRLRVELISKILSTPYERLERLEEGVIQSTLSNDTETVSTFANVIVNLLTATSTMLCCFTYLGFINIYSLLTSIFTILVIAFIYHVVLQSANKLLEEARTTQNIFFKYINDMLQGFKELRLNVKRRSDFEKDVAHLSESYTQMRGKAFLSFANAFIVGELVFTVAIGIIVFFFPVAFKNMRAVDLRSYVFILLYLTGPVNGILVTIPNLVQIRVSWGRVNKLIEDMSEMSEKEIPDEAKYGSDAKINLLLKDVEYEYQTENAEKFKIGPINYEFNSGEIVFITGGNGSGKSTLSKIITGLYRAQSGEILLNNENIATIDLEQKYAAIFSDFHLFDKLYGIDYSAKKNEFLKYMDIMQLNDKIELTNGNFNTTKLSSGQRKRLALAISYLEDRPIYLFDEWAADQDPSFRNYFYKELLLELKQKGKCVIVITHDDRYFGVADKLIKMELGKIIG